MTLPALSAAPEKNLSSLPGGTELRATAPPRSVVVALTIGLVAVGVGSGMLAPPPMYAIGGIAIFGVASALAASILRMQISGLLILMYALSAIFVQVGMPEEWLFPPSFRAAYRVPVVVWPDLILAPAVLVAVHSSLSRLSRAAATISVVLLALSAVLGAVAVLSADTGAPMQAIVGILRGAGVVALVASRAHDSRERAIQTFQVLLATWVVGLLLSFIVLGLALIVNFAPAFLPSGDGFAFSFGGRPRVPGFGNNVAANYLTLSAIAAFLLTAPPYSRSISGGPSRLRPRMWALYGSLGVFLLVAAIAEKRLSVGLIAIVITAATVRWVRLLRGRSPAFAPVAAILGLLFAATTVAASTHAAAQSESRLYLDSRSIQLYLGGSSEWSRSGDGSLITRNQLADAAIEAWRSNKLVGIGAGSWGWSEYPYRIPGDNMLDPHNGYLLVLAEAGVVGVAALYLVPLLVVLRRVWRSSLLALWLGLAVLEVSNANLIVIPYAVAYWSIIAILAQHPTGDVLKRA